MCLASILTVIVQLHERTIWQEKKNKPTIAIIRLLLLKTSLYVGELQQTNYF